MLCKRWVIAVFLVSACLMLLSGILQWGRAAWVDAAPAEGIRVPIVMYHHLLRDPGRGGAYVISPVEFEQDLMTIRAMGMTTVTFKDLVEYIDHDVPLPENPIILTFDDGYESNYVYAFPLLKQYNMKAVISILGHYTEVFSQECIKNVSYSHLTWDEIREMSDSGLIEFGNHTFDLHKERAGSTSLRRGVLRNAGESMEHYASSIREDIDMLQDAVQVCTHREPITFAYPFGFYSKDSEQVIRSMGFRVTLTAREGVSVITRSPESLYLLRRSLRAHGVNSQRFFEKLLEKE